jgi:mono/diheme cytochrome c family protein
MKNLPVIAFLSALIIFMSCGKRHPGAVYMPDMAYSRAYETFMARDSTKFTTDSIRTDDKIFYSALPVTGTIARGEDMPFPYAKDAAGDTTNYVASKQVPNPLPPLNATQMTEAHRLYLINCGICHGPKLDGNGPLYNGGQGPFPSAPKDLAGAADMIAMPDGQMFYSITYGKNMMGSYASQLNRKQRWMVIHFIKAEQAKKKGSGGGSDSTAAKPASTEATAPAAK